MYFTLSNYDDNEDNYININQYSKKSNSTSTINSNINSTINSTINSIKPLNLLNNQMNNHLNIILDLDNTLLNSITFENLDYVPPEIPLKHIDFKISNLNPTFKYRIFARPYLDFFLNEISKFANIAVWTAAGKEYAQEIVNNLFPNNINIDFLFHSEQTEDCLRNYYKMKPLDYLFSLNPDKYNKNNTIIIDDYGMVIDSNKNNSIQIPRWDIFEQNSITFNRNSCYDVELLKMINKIKHRFNLV